MWTTLDGHWIEVRPRDLRRMIPSLRRAYPFWRQVNRHYTGSLETTLRRLLLALVRRAKLAEVRRGASGRVYFVFQSELSGVPYHFWTRRAGDQ
jgi:hypothetical protein